MALPLVRSMSSPTLLNPDAQLRGSVCNQHLPLRVLNLLEPLFGSDVRSWKVNKSGDSKSDVLGNGVHLLFNANQKVLSIQINLKASEGGDKVYFAYRKWTPLRVPKGVLCEDPRNLTKVSDGCYRLLKQVLGRMGFSSCA